MCNTEELYVKELEQVQTKTYHDSPRKARTRLSMSRVMVGRIFHAFVNVESMLGSFLFAAVSIQALQSVEPFTDTLFAPPADYIVPRTLYARTLRLAVDDNVILATWENYSPEPPLVYFPVYRSTDLGQTWTHISNITDTVNGWGLRYQPFLYEMTENIGAFQAGDSLNLEEL